MRKVCMLFLILCLFPGRAFAVDYFGARDYMYEKTTEDSLPKIDTGGSVHIQKFLDRPGDVSNVNRDEAVRTFVKDNYKILKDNATETKDEIFTASGDLTETVGLSTFSKIFARILKLTEDLLAAADAFVSTYF